MATVAVTDDTFDSEVKNSDIPVVVGGIVPDQAVAALEAAGVARVLTPGASADQVVEAVRSATAEGITAMVANGRHSEQLTELVAGGGTCTRFNSQCPRI